MIFKIAYPIKINWSINRAVVEIDDVGIIDVPIQFYGNTIFKKGKPEDYLIVLLGDRTDNLFGILYYAKEEPAQTQAQ